MPQVIHTAMSKLLIQLFNKAATQGSTLYMGLRTDTPTETDTLASLGTAQTEVGYTTAAGYSRTALTVNNTIFADAASGNGWGFTLTSISVPAAGFTGIPNPGGSATPGRHWFITDQASGYTGNLLASGPLNPSAQSGTVQTPTGSHNQANNGTLVVSNTFAGNILVGDWLLVGTIVTYPYSTGGQTSNQELVQISAIGTNGGGDNSFTNLTIGVGGRLRRQYAEIYPYYERAGLQRQYDTRLHDRRDGGRDGHGSADSLCAHRG